MTVSSSHRIEFLSPNYRTDQFHPRERKHKRAFSTEFVSRSAVHSVNQVHGLIARTYVSNNGRNTMYKWELEAKEWRDQESAFWRSMKRLDQFLSMCQHLLIWLIALYLIIYVSRL